MKKHQAAQVERNSTNQLVYSLQKYERLESQRTAERLFPIEDAQLNAVCDPGLDPQGGGRKLL